MLELLKISINLKITMVALVLASVFFYAIPVFAADPTPAPSATSTAVCEGIGLTGGDCATGGASGNKVNKLIATIINVFSWVVGAVAVIMLIFGGFKYVTSGGDANKVKAAKDTIIYALVGVAIVALSQIIVFFVLDTANKAITTPTTYYPGKITYNT